MTAEVLIREATSADIPEILRHRQGMYEDMDYKDQQAIAAMISTSRHYLHEAMANGSFRSWLAVAGTQIVAGGGIVISPWPSHPYDKQCRRATILNVYTNRAHRRKGIARQLMLTMIEWCRKEGFATVTLHASENGRALYESLGFEPTNEMRLKIGT